MENQNLNKLEKIRHVQCKDNTLVRMSTYISGNQNFTYLTLMTLKFGKDKKLEYIANKKLNVKGLDLIYDEKKDILLLFTTEEIVYIKVLEHMFKIFKILKTLSFQQIVDGQFTDITKKISNLTYVGCTPENDRVYYLSEPSTNPLILLDSVLCIFKLSNFEILTPEDDGFENLYVIFKRLTRLGTNSYISVEEKYSLLFTVDNFIYIVGKTRDYRNIYTYLKRFNPQEQFNTYVDDYVLDNLPLEIESPVIPPGRSVKRVGVDKWSDGIIYISVIKNDMKMDMKMNMNTKYFDPEVFVKELPLDANAFYYSNAKDTFTFQNNIIFFDTDTKNVFHDHGIKRTLIQRFHIVESTKDL